MAGVFALALISALAATLAWGFNNTDTRINDLQSQDKAIVACIENTAYTRSLIGQCITDYKEAK